MISESHQAAIRTVRAFLKGRLEERATIDWALKLESQVEIKRAAVKDLLNGPEGRSLKEPWLSAWRFIEAWWDSEAVSVNPIERYKVKERLSQGDRSRSLIKAIVDIVRPRVKAEPFSTYYLQRRQLPKRPKRIQDLFSRRITSGDVFPASDLGLDTVTDADFLISLAHGLDAAISEGLDTAKMMGLNIEPASHWILGGANRVYHVGGTDDDGEEREPDRCNHGIAPVVKLMHEVVTRLASLDPESARKIAQQWLQWGSPLYVRMWAAIAKKQDLIPGNEVADFLRSLNNVQFWKTSDYPEIAELRARRFADLPSRDQNVILARLRKGPDKQSLKHVTMDYMDIVRSYRAGQEVQRIKLAGAHLSSRDEKWLDLKLDEIPELKQMQNVTGGFPVGIQTSSRSPDPDSSFDFVTGEDRLEALESILSSADSARDERIAERAKDWINLSGNPLKLLHDFKQVLSSVLRYARVWEAFCRSHKPVAANGQAPENDQLASQCADVLSLMNEIPPEKAPVTIDAMSEWLASWQGLVVQVSPDLQIWFTLWPSAVEATNAKTLSEEEDGLNTVAHIVGDHEPADLDTLNTPAGKFVGVFLRACPTIKTGDKPFCEDNVRKRMRDSVAAVIGAANKIVKYRLIEHLRYFLAADPEWTIENLVQPLLEDDGESIDLWRAVARRPRHHEELLLIGESMIKRAMDRRRLHRETRIKLTRSLIANCLFSLWKQQDPAVADVNITQMIRAVEDEVRAHAADMVGRFIADLSSPTEGGAEQPPTPEGLFHRSVQPFLTRIWPQERTLVTPAVSRAFADLPAKVPNAFVEVFEAIERFLVPFECWSMHEYGFYPQEGHRATLDIIDTKEKALALLKLLDLTVGRAEGSVVPHYLSNALEHIQTIAPKLAREQAFKRLATAARIRY